MTAATEMRPAEMAPAAKKVCSLGFSSNGESGDVLHQRVHADAEESSDGDLERRQTDGRERCDRKRPFQRFDERPRRDDREDERQDDRNQHPGLHLDVGLLRVVLLRVLNSLAEVLALAPEGLEARVDQGEDAGGHRRKRLQPVLAKPRHQQLLEGGALRPPSTHERVGVRALPVGAAGGLETEPPALNPARQRLAKLHGGLLRGRRSTPVYIP